LFIVARKSVNDSITHVISNVTQLPQANEQVEDGESYIAEAIPL